MTNISLAPEQSPEKPSPPTPTQPVAPSGLSPEQKVEKIHAFLYPPGRPPLVGDLWSQYQKLWPEAFGKDPANWPPAPQVIILGSKKEFDEAFGFGQDYSYIGGFFVSKSNARGSRPGIYLNAHLLSQADDKNARFTVAHELGHSLSAPFIDRLDKDSKDLVPGFPKAATSTYPGVAEDLELSFKNLHPVSDNELKDFTVKKLLTEYAAEWIARQATGFDPSSHPYDPIGRVGDELVNIVGEATFKKAVLGNDPVAYEWLIKVAKQLQVENMRQQVEKMRQSLAGEKASLESRYKKLPPYPMLGNALSNEDVEQIIKKLVDPAQKADDPLSKAVQQIIERLLVEERLFKLLKENFPAEVKNFDFTRLQKVLQILDPNGNDDYAIATLDQFPELRSIKAVAEVFSNPPLVKPRSESP